MQQMLISEVDRLISRLETLQRKSQPALDKLTNGHNGTRHSPPNHSRPCSREAKPCYRQKTFWVGLALVGTGVFELSQGESSGTSIAHVAQGLGLITIRGAIADLNRHI